MIRAGLPSNPLVERQAWDWGKPMHPEHHAYRGRKLHSVTFTHGYAFETTERDDSELGLKRPNWGSSHLRGTSTKFPPRAERNPGDPCPWHRANYAKPERWVTIEVGNGQGYVTSDEHIGKAKERHPWHPPRGRA